MRRGQGVTSCALHGPCLFSTSVATACPRPFTLIKQHTSTILQLNAGDDGGQQVEGSMFKLVLRSKEPRAALVHLEHR